MVLGATSAEASETPTLDALEEGSANGDGDEGDVTLDEILGDGTRAHLESQLDGVSSRCVAATVALAAAQERGIPVDDYVVHCDGAWLLAEALDRTSRNLCASASWDPATDEITFDTSLEEATIDLMERVDLALPILDDILVLANRDSIEVIAGLVDSWATMGAEWAATLAIRADTGLRMMEHLIASFTEHQAAYEKHLTAGKMDVATLFVGPMMEVRRVPDALRRLWTLGRAFGAIGSDPASIWDTVRTARSFGSAMAGEVARSLGRDNPFSTAWRPVSILLSTCQTIVDLGLATTDVALMQQDLRLAREVQAEYGEAMAFFTENEASLTAMSSVLVRLVGLSERVGAALDALEAKVAAAGTDLYPS